MHHVQKHKKAKHGRSTMGRKMDKSLNSRHQATSYSRDWSINNATLGMCFLTFVIVSEYIVFFE